LIGLVLVAIVGIGLTLALGTKGAVAHPEKASEPCAVVQQVAVGLELSIPLLKIDARQQCNLTTTRAGQFLTVTGWVLQLLGWAFATLFVAGFTGAVRRSNK
jgi:hypothetical protein